MNPLAVGGAGATLSGGQRARLALARALYSGADVLLLDDCLAAVDTGVAAWILRHALLGPLLWGGRPPPPQQQTPGTARSADACTQRALQAGEDLQPRPRTLLVATHSPELLAAADLVVEMRGGTIAEVRRQPEAARRRAELAAACVASSVANGSPAAPAEDSCHSLEAGSSKPENDESDKQEQGGSQGGKAPAEASPAGQQQEEERQRGHVRWGVYRQYAAATGWGWVAAILLSLLLMQARHRGRTRLLLQCWRLFCL